MIVLVGIMKYGSEEASGLIRDRNKRRRRKKNKTANWRQLTYGIKGNKICPVAFT
jgi:hypothetical protein